MVRIGDPGPASIAEAGAIRIDYDADTVLLMGRLTNPEISAEDLRIYSSLVRAAEALSHGASLFRVDNLPPEEVPVFLQAFDVAQGQRLRKPYYDEHGTLKFAGMTRLSSEFYLEHTKSWVHEESGEHRSYFKAHLKSELEDHEDINKYKKISKVLGRVGAGLAIISGVVGLLGFATTFNEIEEARQENTAEKTSDTGLKLITSGIVIGGIASVSLAGKSLVETEASHKLLERNKSR